MSKEREMILQVLQNIKIYNYTVVNVRLNYSFGKSVTMVLWQFVFLLTPLFLSPLFSWMTRPLLNTVNLTNLTDLLGSNVSLAYGWNHCQAP